MKRRWIRWILFTATMFCLTALCRQTALAGTLILPAGLTAVQDEAFFGDASLDIAVLPDGLQAIGSKAFAESGLTAVNLPDTLESIADDAFDGPGRVTVTAEKYSYAYRWAVENGYIVPFTWIENSDGTVIITGYTDQDTVLSIPDSIHGRTVTAIGDNAFSGNTLLREVSLPGTLTWIGESAFDGCENLSRPDLPLGLREIGRRAFYGVVSKPALQLPRSLTSIGEDAFTGYRFLNVYAGTWSEQWAYSVAENPDSRISVIVLSIAGVRISTKVAAKDEQVTCTTTYIERGIQSFRWQRSFDREHWTDCEGEGADSPEYTFTASAENCGCSYRFAGTDFTGTYYSAPITLGYLGEECHISDAYVSGTDISLSWGENWEGITYTLYMTGPDETETVLTEGMEEPFFDVTGLEPETAYSFRLKASYGELSVNSVPITVTTQNYRTGAVCRALLIGQVYFGRGYEDCPDSVGDLNLMGNMLQHVTGPQGNPYSMVRQTNLTADQIHQAIRSTFAAADEDDVSLFFIATHGNEESDDEDELGALIAYNPVTRKNESIRDTTLAEWLSEIPGEVIVFLEACSSGSAIYDSGAAGAGTPAAANAAVVRAFQDRDQTILLSGERLHFNENGEAEQLPPLLGLGALRNNKFHVLTSSAHLEDSYAYDMDDFPHTLFTYGLTQGVGLSGRMPCDTNGDGFASLDELARYIGEFQDPYLPEGIQHVQAYPENSDYLLFGREN